MSTLMKTIGYSAGSTPNTVVPAISPELSFRTNARVRLGPAVLGMGERVGPGRFPPMYQSGIRDLTLLS